MPRSATLALRLLPGLLTLAPAHALAAQAAPAVVPAELARALLGDEAATLVVGEAPAPLAGLPLPPGARVLGGMTQPRALTVIVSLALEPGAAMEAAAAALAGSDWTPASPLFTGRIFVDAGASARARTFCTPDAGLRITADPAAGGGSALRYVRNDRAGGFNVCNPPPAFGRGLPIEDAPVPLLVNPEGLVQQGGGGRGGPSSREAAIRLTTSMDPVALAGHYARQLAEQGWSPVAAATATEGAAESWRRDGEGGRRWHALLLVTPLPDGSQKEIFFRIWDPGADG